MRIQWRGANFSRCGISVTHALLAEEGRMFFFKKRAKKPLLFGLRGHSGLRRVRQRAKVSWFLFAKKNAFLS
jgi:hypothetical protein